MQEMISFYFLLAEIATGVLINLKNLTSSKLCSEHP
jgi:hypothetical protein